MAALTEGELRSFKRAYGTVGGSEKRTVSLAQPSAKVSGSGDGRLHVKGHASVFDSPSVRLQGRYGSFIETISRHAFDAVLATKPDVLLLWDHDSRYPLARTGRNLELSLNAHGLRFYADVTPTSYADDLRSLMTDGVIDGASFMFEVQEGGQEWELRGDTLHRTINIVSALHDVTITAMGAYPTANSEMARTVYLDYALTRGYITTNPDGALRAAKLRADLDLRRRRLSLTA